MQNLNVVTTCEYSISLIKIILRYFAIFKFQENYTSTQYSLSFQLLLHAMGTSLSAATETTSIKTVKKHNFNIESNRDYTNGLFRKDKTLIWCGLKGNLYL